MKWLLRFIILLVVVLIIGVVVAFMFINSIARNAVEKGATYALGVPTTLNSADVRVFKGEFDMGGLRVANPTGFDTPHFLTLDDGGVAVSLGSLREDTVELPVLRLTGIDVNLEKKAGKSNYNTITENLKKLSGDAKPAADAPQGKRFIVREIVIRDVLVHVDVLPIGGELTRLHMPIPEITLRDVGSDTEKGVLMSELTGVIIRALFAAIIQKGGDLLPKDLLGDLGNALAGLGDLGKFGITMAGEAIGGIGGALGDLGKGAGEIGQGLGEGIGKGIGDLGKGIGDLLGGPKKEEK